MNALIQVLAKSGLLTKDLDYNLICASMVLIFLAFGYQKWFAYEAPVLIPYISNGPLSFWMHSAFGIRGGQLVSGCFRVAIRHAVVPRTLDQATGNPGSHLVDCHVRHDGYHHSVLAERLGSGCWLSCNGRQCSFPNEGCRPRGLDLLTQAGCHARA